MLARLRIFPLIDHEIDFIGDAANLQKMQNVLSVFHQISNTSYIENDKLLVMPSFTIGLSNLNKVINGSSLLHIILKLIKNKHIDLSPCDEYLLNYWRYEMEMVSAKKSFRPTLNESPQNYAFTSPLLLKSILDYCKNENYLPGFEQLFNLLEHSVEMDKHLADIRSRKYLRQPVRPNDDEILKFIRDKENNLGNIKNKVFGNYQFLLFDCQSTKVFDDYIPQDRVRLIQ